MTPVLLRPKLIFKDLWRLKLGWDTPIPSELENLRLLWKEYVSEFSKIEIPRCHGFCNETPKKLHIFADASTVAYGAATYFRFHYQNDQIECSLIMGKSRLIPLKEKSIAISRLELQAAVIATVGKLTLSRIVKFNQTTSVCGPILKLC